MLSLNINNETDTLRVVIIGHAKDFGGTPLIDDAFDPTSKRNILNKNYPSEENLINELDGLKLIFKKYDIKVLALTNIKKYNQIFARDIGFVIDNFFIRASLIKNRQKEINGLNNILSLIDQSKIIELPKKNIYRRRRCDNS